MFVSCASVAKNKNWTGCLVFIAVVVAVGKNELNHFHSHESDVITHSLGFHP